MAGFLGVSPFQVPGERILLGTSHQQIKSFYRKTNGKRKAQLNFLWGWGNSPVDKVLAMKALGSEFKSPESMQKSCAW